jgi:hypothetical protein
MRAGIRRIAHSRAHNGTAPLANITATAAVRSASGQTGITGTNVETNASRNGTNASPVMITARAHPIATQNYARTPATVMAAARFAMTTQLNVAGTVIAKTAAGMIVAGMISFVVAPN